MLERMMLAYQIAEAVTARQLSAEAVIAAALERAEAVQRELNAFITIDHDGALAKARALDAHLAAGQTVGPLAGVPVVIKDNICTHKLRTTAASKSLSHFIPPYDATVVARLRAAGAIIVAKANLDEFGMGSSNENSAFGAARNPWNTLRVPGGSSGGSAIAVATGVAPLALGTDTGGSVRQPAGFTGVIGYKPTYGRLSRSGVIAFASSLDQVGVLARSARDIALAMDAMSGYDPHDATSLQVPPAFGERLANAPLRGLRIGIVQELAGQGNSAGIRAALERFCNRLSQLGADIGSVSLPHAPYGIAAYYLVAPAEASSNLARYDGMIYSQRLGENHEGQVQVMMRSRGAGFGAEVRRRILMGTYALSAGYYDAFYGKALKVRRLIADDFAKAFETFDLLLTPTSPTVAYPLGSKTDDPLAMYLDDSDTVLANLVGIPAVSVPAGLAEDAMPCGMQLLAPTLHDERLTALVAALEQQADLAPLAPAYR
jgi:aspartyl-tRNA(Asn)/glutamyl-tRNA(Gln) amidotransferase subunit A